MDLDLELKAFMEAMKKNGCPMWMFERDEDGNFEDMTMAHSWYAWQEKAKAQAVPDSSHGVILTCEQLKDALEFGAPDLKIESNEFSDEQMGTELAIIYQESGHSGEGFYSYCVECPDEGSIKLGESESGAEG